MISIFQRIDEKDIIPLKIMKIPWKFLPLNDFKQSYQITNRSMWNSRVVHILPIFLWGNLLNITQHNEYALPQIIMYSPHLKPWICLLFIQINNNPLRNRYNVFQRRIYIFSYLINRAQSSQLQVLNAINSPKCYKMTQNGHKLSKNGPKKLKFAPDVCS